MSTPIIRNVIFDVGKVLYQWDLRHLFVQLIDDPAELDWFLANVVTQEWHFEHDAGRPLAEMVPERIAQFPDYATHIEAYAARFNDTIPGPVPGSLELVEGLAANAIPLFGITNFGAEFWAEFRPTAPIFDHFIDIIVSGEERISKPDPAIYRLALQRFGVTAESCIFIDDRAENVAGAKSVGMNGHVFKDAPTLERELAALELL
ncbi:MAG: HAD family phosphatase [Parasphingorhabdus sp.]|nr:HAD family phosphatase [Parasphingorhabdus sp.]